MRCFIFALHKYFLVNFLNGRVVNKFSIKNYFWLTSCINVASLPNADIFGDIVFTHGVRMDGWAGGGKKFVRPVSQKP